MLIKIYFRCKPIYKSVTQKKLSSYKSKVYIWDNFFVLSHIINNQLKILNKTKKYWQILNYHYIWTHGRKQHTTFREKRYLFSNSTLLKNRILTSVKIGAIFQNWKWLKKQILPSVNIEVILQNSTWFKENKIVHSVKIGAMYIWKLNMVRKRIFYLR